MIIKNLLKNKQLFVEKNFINSALVDAKSGKTLPVINPSTKVLSASSRYVRN